LVEAQARVFTQLHRQTIDMDSMLNVHSKQHQLVVVPAHQDCGGGTCPGCWNGRICVLGRDCVSQMCASGLCVQPATCTNRVRRSRACMAAVGACQGWSKWAVYQQAAATATTLPPCGHASTHTAQKTNLGGSPGAVGLLLQPGEVLALWVCCCSWPG
jgi:hypothetical protein